MGPVQRGWKRLLRMSPRFITTLQDRVSLHYKHVTYFIRISATFLSLDINTDVNGSHEEQQVVQYRCVPTVTVNQLYSDSESARESTLFMPLFFISNILEGGEKLCCLIAEFRAIYKPTLAEMNGAAAL